jgi:hypothetical protein
MRKIVRKREYYRRKEGDREKEREREREKAYMEPRFTLLLLLKEFHDSIKFPL